MIKQKCVVCEKEVDFAEWAVYHNSRKRPLCSDKCFKKWFKEYFEKKEEVNAFTKDEMFHLGISKVICDWNDGEGDINAVEAMKQLTKLDVDYLTEDVFCLSNYRIESGDNYFIIPEENVKEFIKKMKEGKKEEIIYLDELDKYFPKGDKRRGEVLALLGMLNVKQDAVIDKYAGNNLI